MPLSCSTSVLETVLVWVLCGALIGGSVWQMRQVRRLARDTRELSHAVAVLREEQSTMRREFSQPLSVPEVSKGENGGGVAAETGFQPLDIALPEDLQAYTWALCRAQETHLPAEELYDLVLRLMWRESGFLVDVPDNRNPGGSVDRGLMQINSVNWAWLLELGFDVSDPRDNIAAGVYILCRYLDRYDGDVEYALTAYACGPAGADKLGGRSVYYDNLWDVDFQGVAA